MSAEAHIARQATIKFDLRGKTFGRLKILSRAPSRKKIGAVWFCACDCGNFTTASTSQLRANRKKSCGCYRRELMSKRQKSHGLTKTPEYGIWGNMLYRCNNSKCKEYKNYGGRGISVASRWFKFENFIKDMGTRPSSDLTLDRINNNGNYEPGNCRWTDWKTQANNKRNSRK